MKYLFNDQNIEDDQEWLEGLEHQADPEMKEAVKIQDPISTMTLTKPLIIDLGTSLRHVLDKMQDNYDHMAASKSQKEKGYVSSTLEGHTQDIWKTTTYSGCYRTDTSG